MRTGPPKPGTPCRSEEDCGREATIWFDNSGIANHGFERPWCEVCVLHVQINHAESCAERLPDLRLKRDKLLHDGEEIVKACPWCGNEVQNSCHHDGHDVRSNFMPRYEAWELRSREGT